MRMVRTSPYRHANRRRVRPDRVLVVAMSRPYHDKDRPPLGWGSVPMGSGIDACTGSGQHPRHGGPTRTFGILYHATLITLLSAVGCGGAALSSPDADAGPLATCGDNCSAAQSSASCSATCDKIAQTSCSSGGGADCPMSCEAVASMTPSCGNVWQAECAGSTCTCAYNGGQACTCTMTGAASSCSSCCPGTG